MSIYAHSFNENVTIDKDKEEELLVKLRSLYHFQSEDTLKDIFDQYGFSLVEDETCYYLGEFTSKWDDKVEEFLESLAPYIEGNSSICFRWDDDVDTIWRAAYDGRTCSIQSADHILVWDEGVTIDNIHYSKGHHFTVGSDEDANKLTEYLNKENIAYNTNTYIGGLLERDFIDFTFL